MTTGTPRDSDHRVHVRQQDEPLVQRGAGSRPEPLLLSAEQAAERLNIHRATLYDLIGRGELRSVKIGRRRLIPPSALDEFIATNLREGLRG